MRNRFRKEGFTLVELLVVIAIIGILVALLLPAIQAAREAARRNQCINNLKNVGLSMHNHHDIHGRLPQASTAPYTTGCGSTTSGYSWVVGLLPFMEENALWDNISQQTQNFKLVTYPFQTSTPIVISTASSDGAKVANVNLQILRCPSYGGPDRVTALPYVVSGTADPQFPAISNYRSCSQTHVVSDAFVPASSGGQTGNGTLTFPTTAPTVGVSPNKGLGLKAITDGTSKTVILCESKEQLYSSWIDGSAMYAVAAWPSGTTAISTAADGFLGWSATDVTNANALPSLNVGSRGFDATGTLPTTGTDTKQYWTNFPGKNGGAACNWGPSAEHTAGTVNHVFGDGHVTSIVSSVIDKNTYVRLYSRGGGEPVVLE